YMDNNSSTTNQLNRLSAIIGDLLAEDATITGILNVGTSAHTLNGITNTVSLAGGILQADVSGVDFAGFHADATSLTRTTGTIDVSMGDVLGGSVEGFGAVKGGVNNAVWMGKVATDDYELAVRSGGGYLVQLGSRANNIAGANIDASGMWSAGNGN